MQTIQLKDKEFRLYISNLEIEKKIAEIALKINSDYHQKELTLVIVLNGAFRFAAQLIRSLTIPIQITFLRVSSYRGIQSAGKVENNFDVDLPLGGKDVLIVEDIIDSGLTLQHISAGIKKQQPASLKVATLLYKPAALKYDVTINYVGFEIPNDFVVGFGLDYDQQGRGLNDIFVLNEKLSE